MTHAGEPGDGATRVVLLGNDAIAAAAPATPVQLMHACRAAGYALVVPPNWGDELVATEALRQLDGLGRQPAVLVACPLVAARVEALPGGPDVPMVCTVAPPVAAARHLRRLAAGAAMHLTYVGACPDAEREPELDLRLSPDEFLAALADAGIVLAEMPELFEDMLPPDRRRWVSLPGGVPMPAAVARRGGHVLVELDGVHAETAARWRAAARGSGVIDAAAGLGCACSGALPGRGGTSARARAAAADPPRARSAVMADMPGLNLERRVTITPAAPPVTPTSLAAVRASPPRGNAVVPPTPATPVEEPRPTPPAIEPPSPEPPAEAPTPARAPQVDPAPSEAPNVDPPPAEAPPPAPMVATASAPPVVAAPVVAAPAVAAPVVAAPAVAAPAPRPVDPSRRSWLARPLPMRVQLPVMAATIAAVALLARLTRPDAGEASDAVPAFEAASQPVLSAPVADSAPAPRRRSERSAPGSVARPLPPRAPAATPSRPRVAAPAITSRPRATTAARPAAAATVAVPAPVSAPEPTPPVAAPRETTVSPPPRPAVDSAALERESIRRELDARRQRLDSIQRRIDSLYRVRRPPN